MKNIDALIVERTELPQKVLDKVKREKRDWFMTREECLKYKLINFDGRLDDVYNELFPDEEEEE